MSHKKWYMDGDRLPWMDADYDGKITTQCAAGDYDADALDDASVVAVAAATKIIVTIPNGWVGIEFRFRSDGNADDDIVLQAFASSGVDWYRFIATLTIKQGTLDCGATHFDDSVVETATGLWPTTIKANASTDFIGGWSMNTHGYDRWLFLASDLDTTTQYIDFKQL